MSTKVALSANSSSLARKIEVQLSRNGSSWVKLVILYAVDTFRLPAACLSISWSLNEFGLPGKPLALYQAD